MISRIHSKLGTAGFIVAIVALVAALGGGAYAAQQGLNGKQKKEVKNIAKKYAGKDGAPGAPGAPGANGKDGSNGSNGADGKEGPAGKDGKDGASVTGSPIAANGVCGKKTGVKYTLNATSTNVCSGEDGATGFTEKLPSGETETGAWSYGIVDHSQIQRVAVSFNIPLGSAPTYHVIKANGKEKVFNPVSEEFEDIVQPACPGTFEEPAANAGVLCLYTSSAFGGETNVFWAGHPAFSTTYKTGAVIGVLPTPATTESSSFGTWAVTAP